MDRIELVTLLHRLGRMYRQAERGKQRLRDYLRPTSEAYLELEGEFSFLQWMLKDHIRRYGQLYHQARR